MSDQTLPEKHRLGPRFTDALAYAADVHVSQPRKVADEDEPTIPYLGHLLSVAGEVIDSGGNEDEAIAALLHDAVEDQGGREQLAVIERRFGGKVAEIVKNCSDTLEGEDAKEDWGLRKKRYIAHVLEEGDVSALRVSVADKLQNVRAIIRDHGQLGDKVWERFNRPKAFTLGYHTALREAYEDRAKQLGVELPLLEPYGRAIDELAEIAGVDPEPLEPKSGKD